MNRGWRQWVTVNMLWLGLSFCYAAEPDPREFATRAFQAKGYKVAEHYGPPHESQIKSLLEGGSFTPLVGGQTLLSNGITLQTFTESNTLQLVIKAPECLYDSAAQTASSTGPLRVETPDGKFSIEGRGFLWQQTNTSLFISNQVHTVVTSDALQANTVSSQKTAAAPEPTLIFSDLFSYDSASGKAIYRQNVRVSNTNLNLTGGMLTVEIPRSDRQLQTVTAQQDVTIDYSARGTAAITSHIQTKGQRADFSSKTGLIRISGGHPTWQARPHQGRADELIIDRTNQIFQANGHAWLEMPRQTFESSGFLAQAPRKSGRSTNGLVEVQCDSYELHTNWGVFRKKVGVTERLDNQVHGRLNCGEMTLTFAGSNQLERLVAQTNVVIEQETNRFAANRAVFTAKNDLLELTGNPSWQAGPRQGKGDILLLNTKANELRARGHAFMRVPADEFAGQLLPATGGQTSKRPSTEPGQWAEITCQEYTLRSNSASFRGKVHALHPKMQWVCEQLLVESPAGEHAKPESILAETGVNFELENPDGQKVCGTADRAVYTFTVSATRTNDLLTLFGNPATLTNTTATLRNDKILYDRLSNTLATPGTNYHIEGVAPATHTNLFALPKLKTVK